LLKIAFKRKQEKDRPVSPSGKLRGGEGPGKVIEYRATRELEMKKRKSEYDWTQERGSQLWEKKEQEE